MIEILRILDEHNEIMGAKSISQELHKKGYVLGERAVRYHMHILDEKGYTEKIGYSGRKITEIGKIELKKGLIYDQVDFTYSTFEEKMYGVTLNPKTGKGSVIVNISSINDLKAKDIIKDVFNEGLAVSSNINIMRKNNKLLFETICGTTIDGVLQKSGIITQPKCGGIIKIEDNIPLKFEEQIAYKKTSLTPLEAFTGKGTTSILDVINTGTGLVPANFRTIPAIKKDETLKIFKSLNKIGINGIIHIGNPGETVLGVPVEENMMGIAIIGGVSPLCAAQEAGFDLDIKLADNYADYSQMIFSREKSKVKLKSPSTKKQTKISFILTKAYNLISQVNLDINTFTGNVISNISYIDKKYLDESLDILDKMYHKNQEYCIGNNYSIIEGPENKVGIATICSLTMDGILTKEGIHSTPLYSGILDIENNKRRFIELISYTGSSVDPHEIFIKKNMHNINGAINGSGQILANVHEIPYVARDHTLNILDQIKEEGFNALTVGKPNEYVYNANTDMYYFGFATVGGLNPITNLKENNIPIEVKAIEKIMNYNEFKK